MVSRKGQGGAILAAIIVLVTVVIGVSIIDVITNTNVNGVRVPATGNETVGTANSTGYLSATLATPPVVAASEQVFCNETATTNYTLTDATGAIVVDGADCSSDIVYAAYYNTDSRYSFSLSRTIITYVAPIALLGALAIAAVIFGG